MQSSAREQKKVYGFFSKVDGKKCELKNLEIMKILNRKMRQ